jgi:hypothetical protein
MLPYLPAFIEAFHLRHEEKVRHVVKEERRAET